MLVGAGLLAGRLVGRRARRRADVRSASPTTAADGAAGAVRSGGAPLGLSGLRRLIFFPDDQAGWLPFALAAVLRRRSTGSFDAIYSTSSPVTSHLIAGLTKRLTGVPWVAEFRDPWLGNALAAPLPWFHRRLQVRLERWIARTADALVCVTPSLAAMYHRRYPGATVVTITNGYERSERSRPTPRSSGPYRLVWTGSLYRPDELRVFLEGVTMLVDRRPAVREELSITLYGTVSAGCREVADRFGGSGPLAGMLSFPGFVPRPVALQAVADADAGLLLLGDGPGMELFATGKLFDYLGQGRQVFAMVPPGDARDILAELDWGVVADPRPEAVAGALERLLASARRNHYADPEGRYDRSVLVARLVRLLDEIVRPRRQADGSGGSR